MKRLDGKVALVTGGSRGIGRAICQAFVREGAAVIVNFTKNGDKAEALVKSIQQDGGRAAALQADISSQSQVRAMAERAPAQFGAIDILVNNAGILSPGNALQMKEEEFDRLFAVNVKGIVFCVQAIAPGMIERHYGKIVNLASIAGLSTAVNETTPYAATKAAVVSLTKRMAFELGPHGINVNGIAPGFVKTEMLGFLDTDADRTRLEALKKKAMLGRIGVPEDIANTALFLASDESSFMTAQILTIDGGRMDFLTHSN